MNAPQFSGLGNISDPSIDPRLNLAVNLYYSLGILHRIFPLFNGHSGSSTFDIKLEQSYRIALVSNRIRIKTALCVCIDQRGCNYIRMYAFGLHFSFDDVCLLTLRGCEIFPVVADHFVLHRQKPNANKIVPPVNAMTPIQNPGPRWASSDFKIIGTCVAHDTRG